MLDLKWNKIVIKAGESEFEKPEIGDSVYDKKGKFLFVITDIIQQEVYPLCLNFGCTIKKKS